MPDKISLIIPGMHIVAALGFVLVQKATFKEWKFEFWESLQGKSKYKANRISIYILICFLFLIIESGIMVASLNFRTIMLDKMWQVPEIISIEFYNCYWKRNLISENISYATFLPDGQHIISVSNNGNINKWDIVTKTETETLIKSNHECYFLYPVSISPNTTFAFAHCGYDFVVWNVETGKEIMYFEGSAGLLKSASISPDGKFAISIDIAGNLRLWDLSKGIVL